MGPHVVSQRGCSFRLIRDTVDEATDLLTTNSITPDSADLWSNLWISFSVSGANTVRHTC